MYIAILSSTYINSTINLKNNFFIYMIGGNIKDIYKAYSVLFILQIIIIFSQKILLYIIILPYIFYYNIIIEITLHSYFNGFGYPLFHPFVSHSLFHSFVSILLLLFLTLLLFIMFLLIFSLKEENERIQPLF
jgi:hypothetical protein